MLSESLKNSFIIAMPSMNAPFFYRSVIYVCEHNDEGAMGLIINHPLGIYLEDVLSQMKLDVINPALRAQPVLCGGPLQTERGFVVHRAGDNWEGSVNVDEDIYITSSRDILEAMANMTGPRETIVTLGYAGWGEGQLEQEMAENSWINVSVDADLMFRLPYEKRWEAAIQLLGFNVENLSHEVGHA